jgi:hypothetical protein
MFSLKNNTSLTFAASTNILEMVNSPTARPLRWLAKAG